MTKRTLENLKDLIAEDVGLAVSFAELHGMDRYKALDAVEDALTQLREKAVVDVLG